MLVIKHTFWYGWMDSLPKTCFWYLHGNYCTTHAQIKWNFCVLLSRVLYWYRAILSCSSILKFTCKLINLQLNRSIAWSPYDCSWTKNIKYFRLSNSLWFPLFWWISNQGDCFSLFTFEWANRRPSINYFIHSLWRESSELPRSSILILGVCCGVNIPRHRR